MSARGTLFIVSAPSGAGKSSLIKALLEAHPHDNMQVSVSHTTRTMRPGEQDGIHYHFVSRERFRELIGADAFFEYAEVFGNYYGTSRQAIENQLERGIDVFLDIDWQGARQVKRRLPDARGIFILPPSREELARRLRRRGQDSDEVIAARMAAATAEMSHYDEYDYLIVNGDFQTALTELQHIVNGERLQRPRQAAKYSTIIAQLLAR